MYDRWPIKRLFSPVGEGNQAHEYHFTSSIILQLYYFKFQKEIKINPPRKSSEFLSAQTNHTKYKIISLHLDASVKKIHACMDKPLTVYAYI